MGKFLKITALFLVVIISITSFAFAVLAEGEADTASGESSSSAESSSSTVDSSSAEDSSEASSDTSDTSDSSDTSDTSDTSSEDPNAYHIVIETVGASNGFTVTYNGTEFSGSDYTGSANGSDLSVVLTAKTGYEFLSVRLNGLKQQIVDGKASFVISPEAGETYTIKVEMDSAIPFTVKTGKGVNGVTVTANGTVLTASGDSYTAKSGDAIAVTFAVEGEFNSSLAFLTVGGTAVALESATYNFTLEDTVEIGFTYGYVPVAFSLSGPATITVYDGETAVFELSNSDKSVKSGTAELEMRYYTSGNYVIKITPALNYKISSVNFGAETHFVKSEDGSYSVRPSCKATYTVAIAEAGSSVVTPNQYNVHITAGAGGSVVAGTKTVIGGTSSDTIVPKGGRLSISVIPDEGYEIVAFRVNGVAVTLANNSYVLTNLAADADVSVTFKSKSAPEVEYFNIDAIVLTDGGTAFPSGVASVAQGESHKVVFTADEGYFIGQVLVDGTPLIIESRRTVYVHNFQNITANHTISVSFVPEINESQPESDIESDIPSQSIDTSVNNNSDSDSSSGGVGTVVAILIIVLVAVAGAAALFIVKWRQEKF